MFNIIKDANWNWTRTANNSLVHIYQYFMEKSGAGMIALQKIV